MLTRMLSTALLLAVIILEFGLTMSIYTAGHSQGGKQFNLSKAIGFDCTTF